MVAQDWMAMPRYSPWEIGRPWKPDCVTMASFWPPMSCRHGWKMLRLVLGPSTRIVPDDSSSRRRCASSPSSVPTSAKPAAKTTAARTPSSRQSSSTGNGSRTSTMARSMAKGTARTDG